MSTTPSISQCGARFARQITWHLSGIDCRPPGIRRISVTPGGLFKSGWTTREHVGSLYVCPECDQRWACWLDRDGGVWKQVNNPFRWWRLIRKARRLEVET